jgi:hypothetical protein
MGTATRLTASHFLTRTSTARFLRGRHPLFCGRRRRVDPLAANVEDNLSDLQTAFTAGLPGPLPAPATLLAARALVWALSTFHSRACIKC